MAKILNLNGNICRRKGSIQNHSSIEMIRNISYLNSNKSSLQDLSSHSLIIYPSINRSKITRKTIQSSPHQNSLLSLRFYSKKRDLLEVERKKANEKVRQEKEKKKREKEAEEEFQTLPTQYRNLMHGQIEIEEEKEIKYSSAEKASLLEKWRNEELKKLETLWAPKAPIFYSHKVQDMLYNLYVSNPKYYTAARLSRMFDIDRHKVGAMIVWGGKEAEYLSKDIPVDLELQNLIEENFPNQFVTELPGDSFKRPPTKSTGFNRYVLVEPEVNQRLIMKFIKDTSTVNSVLPGEPRGFVVRDLESIIIKEGTKTPEEVEEAKKGGDLEMVIYPKGPMKLAYPMIIRELDGTIRTATYEERALIFRFIRHKSFPSISFQERINSILSGVNKEWEHPAERARRKGINYILVEDYLKRQQKNPNYFVEKAEERRREREEPLEESARRAAMLAEDIMDYMRKKWSTTAEKTKKNRTRRRGANKNPPTNVEEQIPSITETSEEQNTSTQ